MDKKVLKEQLKNLPDRFLTFVHTNEWQLEFTTVNGDIVQKLTSSKKESPQPYMATGVINSNVDELVKILHDDFENLSTWNEGVISSQRLELIDNDTDINYQLVKGIPGIISKRDFVLLRHRKEIKPSIVMNNESNSKSFVLILESLKYPKCPKVTGIVRGEHILGGWILHGVGNEKTNFKWIVNLDLKMSGFIPDFIVRQALLKTMVRTLNELRGVLQN